MKNRNLAKARKVNNDEFYTSYKDIVSELVHYRDSLQGRVIYCNCDDKWSNFRTYFIEHFDELQLKKLFCSGISGYYMEYDGKNVIESTINGDFRSADSLRILGQSDLCVTNPPFSLFREYISLVKNFLIIGNKNAIAYKEVFPLLKNRIVNFGYTQPSTFTTPNGTVANLRGLCRWLTTLSVAGKPTWTQTARYNSSYQCFDYYPAINVDRVRDIPSDYTGLMGVPITALDKLDFTTYEVIDLITRYAVVNTAIGVKNHQLTEINGVPKYARVIIKLKNCVSHPMAVGDEGLQNDVEYHEFPKSNAVDTASVNYNSKKSMTETENNCMVAEAAAAQQIDEIENETKSFISKDQSLDSREQIEKSIILKKLNTMKKNNLCPTCGQNPCICKKHESDLVNPAEKINYIDRFLSDKYFPTIAANKLQERHNLQLDERLRGDVLSRCKGLGLIEQNGLPSGSLLAELDGVLSTSKIRPRITAQYLVSDLRKIGYKFGYTKENREVDKLHVSKLRSHVKGTSEKCFHETAKVCWAKDMVKTHQLCDLNGTPITADAENLDKYIIILDGQHRLACVIDEPEIDLYVEFVDVADETRYIEELNNYSKVWNGDDYTHCLQQKNPETQKLLTAIANFKAHYGVSNKFAEMALTHAADKFKRADMKGYCEGAKVIDADKFAIDQEQIDLAYAVMDALLAKFDGDRSCKKLEMIASVIEVHKAMEDEFLPDAKRNMKEFIMLLDSNETDAITKAIDSKNQGDLRASWQKAWKIFVSKLTEADRDAMEAEVDDNIKDWFEKHPAAVSNTPTAPKSNKGTLDSLFKGKIVKNHRVAKIKA